MRQGLIRLIPFLAAATLALGAFAQEPKEDPIKQLKLTDAQVKSFISAQPDLATVAPKLQEAGDNIAPALQTELDEIAKKHGFASFEELDSVAANISIVMAGLDSKSGEFTEPVEALKKELSDVTADASIPDADKKQLMQELTEAISTTPRLEHVENVELVKAHRAEIEKALQ
ncbi:hypothetical protein [Hyphomicrobium album]|uniref:hypothetical protein n=1 Tax=Hyphomicrobium album TaxID=2665159 RepID=UPI0018A8B9C7|nr:hypothetical protein [Hyphomicrobium album]